MHQQDSKVHNIEIGERDGPAPSIALYNLAAISHGEYAGISAGHRAGSHDGVGAGSRCAGCIWVVVGSSTGPGGVSRRGGC